MKMENYGVSVAKATHWLEANLESASPVESITKQLKELGGEEKKSVLDQSLRAASLNLASVNGEVSVDALRSLLKTSFILCEAGLASASIPALLLQDAMDISPMSAVVHLFTVLEENVSHWKQQVYFDAGRNFLLRLCNDLLRHSSKNLNINFCGRVQLFLARLFPLEEKSALNLMSHFNLDNVTTYRTEPWDDVLDTGLELPAKEPMDVEEGEMPEGNSTIPVDYALYKKFWSLQDYFRKPSETLESWAEYLVAVQEILRVFSSYKLDSQTVAPDCTSFAKYLTRENLLELQLADGTFRRYLLLQLLILNQSLLTGGVKKTLAESQTTFCKDTETRVYKLLVETPPDGVKFASAIRAIVEREQHWASWKNDNCPPFSRTADTTLTTKVVSRKRPAVGDDLRNSGARLKLGFSELNRLWNLEPDNLAACETPVGKQPELKEFFEESITQLDPANCIEETYKLVNDMDWQWKALRVLSGRGPTFYTQVNEGPPNLRYAVSLKHFLTTQLVTLGDHLGMKMTVVPATNGSAVQEEAEDRSESPEDDIKSSDTPPEEFGPQLPSDDEMNSGDTEWGLESLMPQLSELLAPHWQVLASQHISSDDISLVESSSDETRAQAEVFLRQWHERIEPVSLTLVMIATAASTATLSELEKAVKELDAIVI